MCLLLKVFICKFVVGGLFFFTYVPIVFSDRHNAKQYTKNQRIMSTDRSRNSVSDILTKNAVYIMCKQYQNDVILNKKLIVQIIKVKYSLSRGRNTFEVSNCSLVLILYSSHHPFEYIDTQSLYMFIFVMLFHLNCYLIPIYI